MVLFKHTSAKNAKEKPQKMCTENGAILHGIRCDIARKAVLYCTESGVMLHGKRCYIAQETV